MQLSIFRLFHNNSCGFFFGLSMSVIANPFGGLKWTRTIDLTLIRRVL